MIDFKLIFFLKIFSYSIQTFKSWFDCRAQKYKFDIQLRLSIKLENSRVKILIL